MLIAWFFTLLYTSNAHSTPAVQKALIMLSTPPAVFAPEKSPYTNLLEEDLMKTYAEELSAIRKKHGAGLSKNALKAKISEYTATQNTKVFAVIGMAEKTNEKVPEVFEKIFKNLISNPVSKVDNVDLYDSRGDIGFCFGRAAMVHYLLLKEKISPSQIAKIFMIGKLKYGRKLWEFHMAAMAKSETGTWWVLDSLFDSPLPLVSWVEKVTNFAINSTYPDVRFYSTDPRKFQPGYGAYSLKDFEIPELKRYFDHLFSAIQ